MKRMLITLEVTADKPRSKSPETVLRTIVNAEEVYVIEVAEIVDGDPLPPPPPPTRRARQKVNGRVVTDAEMVLVEFCVRTFNGYAGTRYQPDSRDCVRMIVMRQREHPELTSADHERVIMEAFQDPWWDGRPGPGVIYGKPRLFERLLYASKLPPVAAMGSRRMADHLRQLAEAAE